MPTTWYSIIFIVIIHPWFYWLNQSCVSLIESIFILKCIMLTMVTKVFGYASYECQISTRYCFELESLPSSIKKSRIIFHALIRIPHKKYITVLQRISLWYKIDYIYTFYIYVLSSRYCSFYIYVFISVCFYVNVSYANVETAIALTKKNCSFFQ